MNKIISKLKGLKHKELIIAVIAIVIMLVIYFSSFGKAEEVDTVTQKSDYCTEMKLQIERAISRMEGAGKAEVVINWASGVESVHAQNTTTNGNNTTSQVVQGSSGPIVVKEIYPQAIGVLVVCEGGNNAKIKIDIIMAISTLMDISSEKVLVFGMNK